MKSQVLLISLTFFLAFSLAFARKNKTFLEEMYVHRDAFLDKIDDRKSEIKDVQKRIDILTSANKKIDEDNQKIETLQTKIHTEISRLSKILYDARKDDINNIRIRKNIRKSERSLGKLGKSKNKKTLTKSENLKALTKFKGLLSTLKVLNKDDQKKVDEFNEKIKVFKGGRDKKNTADDLHKEASALSE